MKDRKLLNIELGRLTPEAYRNTRPESGLVLVLDNVRSAHNVGSAFRTADAFGVDKVYLGGICPVPPSPELRKVALGAEEVVPFEHVADVVSLVGRLRSDGYTVIAVEQTEHSVKLDAYTAGLRADSPGHQPYSGPRDAAPVRPDTPEGGMDSGGHRPYSRTTESMPLPDFPKPARIALVFGNEVDGVQQAVVDACDFSLEIPQKGTKHSLNVSVSIGIVLWAVALPRN